MTERPQRQPWERQEGETPRDYGRFLIYRNMGPERSVRKAAGVNKLKKKGQYGAWRYWQQIAYRHQWNDRAREWDEYQEYERVKVERVAEATAREEHAAERVQQRALLTQEAVGLRTIARLLAGRILEVLKDPEALRQLGLKRRKVVVVSRAVPTAPGLPAETEDKVATPMVTERRQEEVYPGVLELIKLAGEGMEAGSRLYRLAQLDEPDEDGKPKTAERRAQEVAQILTEDLLKRDVGCLLALRDELVGVNGKPDREPERVTDE